MHKGYLTCAACGERMVIREIAPCLDCGGDPREASTAHTGHRAYAKTRLFEGEVFCYGCLADLSRTDPRYWGFPAELDWEEALAAHPPERVKPHPPIRKRYACPKCHNTRRKQEFVKMNARRQKIKPPEEYWPYL